MRTLHTRNLKDASGRFGRELARNNKLSMLFLFGEPSFERAPTFLIELITFLFTISLMHNTFGSEELVFFTWRKVKAGGAGFVLKLLAGAVYQTLCLEVR